MGKTKIMVSVVDLQTLKNSGKYSCSVCRKGVGSNSINCDVCLHWAQKKCNGVIGRLKPNPDYCYSKCKGTARTINGRPYNDWSFVQDKKLGLIYSFCYLGNKISAGGVCDLSVITRVRFAWGKVQELMPMLTSCALSYTTCGQIYCIYIQLVLLYVSECWEPSVNDLLKLERNDPAMVWWIYNVSLKDCISSGSLLGINNIQT